MRDDPEMVALLWGTGVYEQAVHAAARLGISLNHLSLLIKRRGWKTYRVDGRLILLSADIERECATRQERKLRRSA